MTINNEIHLCREMDWLLDLMQMKNKRSQTINCLESHKALGFTMNLYKKKSEETILSMTMNKSEDLIMQTS